MVFVWLNHPIHFFKLDAEKRVLSNEYVTIPLDYSGSCWIIYTNEHKVIPYKKKGKVKKEKDM